jgi:hypothetical protein
MLKERFLIACVIGIIMSAFTVRIYALGIGGYVTGKGGVSSIMAFDTSSDVEYAVGAGFILDTSVTKNKIFNYRLGFGYENIMKSGNSFFDKSCFHRISLSNTFGYAFIRSSVLRVWMGPQIELSNHFAIMNKRKTEVYPIIVSGAYPIKKIVKSREVAAFSLGFGAVLGINLNFENQFSMGFEIGINTCLGVGKLKEKAKDYPFVAGGYYNIPDIKSSSIDVAFGKAEILTRLSFMYRVGDEFISETPQNVDIKLQKKE